MHQDQHYYTLAEKWLNGTITGEEKAEFLEWYAYHQDAPLDIPPSFAKNEEELKNRILNKIFSAQHENVPVVSIRKRRWPKLAAACIVLGLGIGGFYLTFRSGNTSRIVPSNISNAKEAASVIKPGRDKAVLTLADGSQILLDTAGHGLIALEQNSRVIKSANGQLVYNEVGGGHEQPVYNTLNIPKGGQYMLTLSDGTKVWLNSASSLRFPNFFAGKERAVELNGEAYFEVAKNAAMPFKVKVNNMEVRVLGTHFNVMGYEDEAEVRTTLLEGSVRVRQNDEQVTILPGQQAQLNSGGKLKVVNKVNTEEVLAWKNGMFQFEEADIKQIMRQIARWYDVSVMYDQNLTGHFSGTIAKNESVEKVLHMLELTGAIHFTINGQTIRVRH